MKGSKLAVSHNWLYLYLFVVLSAAVIKASFYKPDWLEKKCLHNHFSGVSQELSELIMTMIANASALLKQYHNPVGPKPSNPTLPGPQMGPGIPGSVGGTLGGPSTPVLGHGPGMGPSSLASGLGASSSSQV